MPCLCHVRQTQIKYFSSSSGWRIDEPTAIKNHFIVMHATSAMKRNGIFPNTNSTSRCDVSPHATVLYAQPPSGIISEHLFLGNTAPFVNVSWFRLMQRVETYSAILRPSPHSHLFYSKCYFACSGESFGTAAIVLLHRILMLFVFRRFSSNVYCIVAHGTVFAANAQPTPTFTQKQRICVICLKS